MTSKATSNAISSPELRAGRSPSELPAGLTADLFGREAALASPSPLPVNSEASMTNANYGQPGYNSSPSDVLQSSLENRLRANLRGSRVCAIIWKPWNTPWGQCRSRPRARAQTISEIDIGLWPTMTGNSPAKGYNEAGNSAGQVAIRKIALALYPTATTPSGGQKNPPGTTLAGKRPDGTKAQVTLQNVVMAMWSTLRASDGEKGGPNMSFGAGGSPLPSQVSKAGNTSNAPMENGGGSLHPEFAGWEMGYPPVWLNCAPSATPSTGGQRRNSSKPTSDAGRRK